MLHDLVLLTLKNVLLKKNDDTDSSLLSERNSDGENEDHLSQGSDESDVEVADIASGASSQQHLGVERRPLFQTFLYLHQEVEFPLVAAAVIEDVEVTTVVQTAQTVHCTEIGKNGFRWSW